VAKVLASAACIGSGGSAGREGPIVQVGAALGSTLGQLFHMSEARIRNLVACGAAAGIAATFNAPIAGVIFSLEIILGELRLGDLSSVVIAAVTASALARSVLGDRPALTIPEYALKSPWEIFLYVILGILAGLVGVLFIKMLYATEDLFDAWRFPEALKPPVGGLLLGATAVGYLALFSGGRSLLTAPNLGEGLRLPHVYGAGFEAIEAALTGRFAFGLLLSLIFLKLVATSLTLGSGNSGGIFAPGLFSGAMLGGAFGYVVNLVFPGVVAGTGTYATVGMAAVFAAAARAPLTALLIVFEMTDDYRMILPLMAAVVVATVVAQHIQAESIYTLKLVRRGIRLARGRDIDVMDSVQVEEVMNPTPVTVTADLPARALPDLFLQTNSHAFPVLDEEGSLVGMVSLRDYRRARGDDDVSPDLRVIDIATRAPIVAHPDETVRLALRRMAPRDLSQLPVVSRESPRSLLGIVRRNDVIRAYELGTVRRTTGPLPRLPDLPGAETAEFIVGPEAPVAGLELAQISLPRECVVVSVVRQDEMIIPHGDTELQPGDRVTVLLGGCEPERLAELFGQAVGSGV
jgi:CIC family chloride channel protein